MALQPLALEFHQQALEVLLQLRQRAEWEVRHSAMLGIKYLLAVRPETGAQAMVLRVLPAALEALKDPDDDVRGAAADALIPAVPCLVKVP
jgi:TATA-binding protein-associated factor